MLIIKKIEEKSCPSLALLVQGSDCDALKKINDFPSKLKRDFVQVRSLLFLILITIFNRTTY